MKHFQESTLGLKDLQQGQTYFSRKMGTNFIFLGVEVNKDVKTVKISKTGSKIEPVSYAKFFNAYMKEGVVKD